MCWLLFRVHLIDGIPWEREVNRVSPETVRIAAIWSFITIYLEVRMCFNQAFASTARVFQGVVWMQPLEGANRPLTGASSLEVGEGRIRWRTRYPGRSSQPEVSSKASRAAPVFLPCHRCKTEEGLSCYFAKKKKNQCRVADAWSSLLPAILRTGWVCRRSSPARTRWSAWGTWGTPAWPPPWAQRPGPSLRGSLHAQWHENAVSIKAQFQRKENKQFHR